MSAGEFEPNKNPGTADLLSISIEGEQFMLRPDNTVVRTFSEGDGAYDHCLVLVDKDTVLCFRPNQQQVTAMIENGFTFRPFETIDQRTNVFYREHHFHLLTRELNFEA